MSKPRDWKPRLDSTTLIDLFDDDESFVVIDECTDDEPFFSSTLHNSQDERSSRMIKVNPDNYGGYVCAALDERLMPRAVGAEVRVYFSHRGPHAMAGSVLIDLDEKDLDVKRSVCHNPWDNKNSTYRILHDGRVYHRGDQFPEVVGAIATGTPMCLSLAFPFDESHGVLSVTAKGLDLGVVIIDEEVAIGHLPTFAIFQGTELTIEKVLVKDGGQRVKSANKS